MRHFALFTIAILFATVGLAQTQAHDHAAMMENHDRMFADAMTKHHEDGIRMSEMAVQKAQSAELRSMAQKMITDQRSQIERMQSLRPEGPKMSMEEMKEMPGMMPESEMQRDMARLESASGEAFDLAFTEIMPKHHEGAVKMSQHEISNGKIEGMKDVAREIADMQSRERQQLMAMHESLAGEPQSMTSSTTERTRMTKD